MRRIRPDLDIVLDILQAVETAYPENEFIRSIHRQYIERGGLSKKQLQGLWGKAGKLKNIPAGKLATLEAIILKKPSKTKSTGVSVPAELSEKNDGAKEMILDILSRYPGHKRVLFLQAKLDQKVTLSPAELTDLQRLFKILK